MTLFKFTSNGCCAKLQAVTIFIWCANLGFPLFADIFRTTYTYGHLFLVLYGVYEVHAIMIASPIQFISHETRQ